MIAGGITGGASYLGWKGSSTPSKSTDPYGNNSSSYGDGTFGGSYYNPPTSMTMNENDSIAKS